MKIYTQNYNLNERTDKQFYCPPNSNFKIGVKATENGQEVALSNINIYDGTSDGYVEQKYSIDMTIPEGYVYTYTFIINDTGRDIPGEELSVVLESLSWSFESGANNVFRYYSWKDDGSLITGAAWSRTNKGTWMRTKGVKSIPLEPLSAGYAIGFENDTYREGVIPPHPTGGNMIYKKYGYKSSDGEYKGYKTFNISSDYDSKTYDVKINENQPVIRTEEIFDTIKQVKGLARYVNFSKGVDLKLTQNVTDSTVYDIAEGGGSEYVLPVASSSTLGGVKVNGNNLTIAADGTLSAAAGSPYVLPVASSNTLGGVKVNGNGMAIAADGTLSCTVQGGGSTVQDTEFISYNLAEHQPSTPSWMHMFDLYEIPITLDGGTKFIDLYTTGTAPSSGVDISFKVTRPQGSPNPNGYMYKSTTIYLKRDTLADPMVCMYIDDTSLSLTVSEVYQCDNTYKGPTFTANGNFLDDVHYPVVDASNASVPSKITLTPYMLGDGTIGYIMKCEYFNEQS